MDINATNMRSIYTAISSVFNEQLVASPTYYQTVAMSVPSTTHSNKYPRFDDLPGIREWVGDRVVHGLSGQSYTIENKPFEVTIGLSRDDVEDDQVGMFKSAVQQLAQEAASFPDNLVFPLFRQGDQQRCYDGQYFFDEDHPGFDADGQETSVSNITKGSDPAWYLIDDTKIIKPMVFQNRRDFTLVAKDEEGDENVFLKNQFLYGVSGRCNAGFGLWQLAYCSKVPLTPDNYQAARQKMMGIRKRNGQVINIRPTKLLVPPNLEGQALQLASAEMINGTSNIWRGSIAPVVIPLLG